MTTVRLRAARASAVLLLLIAGCGPVAPSLSAADAVTLDVPFLPQTEDLCGGATAAMLFRYWGERHATVRQFAPLVDRAAGGIADVVLIEAIRQRHWRAERIDGSVQMLRDELAARRPPMLLIEDRPGRYHYVIVVGIDEEGVLLHDPTWGPSRRVPFARLHQTWKPSGFWTLRVTPLPAATRARAGSRADAGVTPNTPTVATSACDQRLDAALDEIARRGLDVADTLLPPLALECPEAAGPRRELAGIRFAQRRWPEAEALAAEALQLAPSDRYAADVLGSSRFMRNDMEGALRAWNLAGKPTLDSVRISGLTRTRYALLANALGLPVDRQLTPEAYLLARRRLDAWPDFSSTRLSLRPDDEQYTVVDVAVVERATRPKGAVQWIAAGTRSVLEREVAVSLPGRTGQGETWSAVAGWWEHRPRLSLAFAAPLTTGPRGVWRVEAAWAEQSYGSPAVGVMRETQLGGSVSLTSWVRPNLRLTAGAGLDAWRLDDSERRRALTMSGSLERRFLNDRASVSASAAQWFGLAGASGFGTAGAALAARSSRELGRLVVLGRTGISVASEGAPLALWGGAGEGRSRSALLRAHRLLHDGRIDGAVFGRRLAYGTLEAQHWFERPRLLRIAGAVFVDAASASRRPTFATGGARQVDAGAGLRLRVPGGAGTFRVDYARGLADNASSWFVGWQTE